MSVSNGCRFLFGIHCHQPVGNFGGVLEEVYQASYRPLLETFNEYPACPFTVHYSGPLLEWLEGHHPEHLELLAEMSRRGQVEFLGGGFYEPILAAIPPRDRRDQLMRMRDFLGERLGRIPTGAWLAERVWSPDLAEDLAAAGYGYVLLDDYHFRCAGLGDGELDGYYLTEAGGSRVAVLPISQGLRYLVPFHPVEEVVDTLAAWPGMALLVDDGEKFGAWPGTAELVHQGGWLRRFLTALQNHPGIAMTTIAEALAQVRPKGYAYLPTASYAEMGEWAMSAGAGRRLTEARSRVGGEGVFLQGGTFPYFFVKYPEAGYLRQRVLGAGREKAIQADPKAKEHLLRAQCNDAYWHGIFGGVYLPHLRRALWGELLAAEAALPPAVWEKDLDGDGQMEIYCRTGEATLAFRPTDGGTMRELSLGAWGANLGDVLARRPERYHLQGSGQTQGGHTEGVATIHQGEGATWDGGAYDSSLQSSFRDIFRNGFATGAYEAEFKADIAGITLGLSREEGGGRLEKEFFIPFGERNFQVRYAVWGEREEQFSTEVVLALPAGASEAGRFNVDGREMDSFAWAGELTGHQFSFHDGVVGGTLRLKFDREARAIFEPIRTRSRCERGLEEIMQGLKLRFNWCLDEKIPLEVQCRVSWD